MKRFLLSIFFIVFYFSAISQNRFDMEVKQAFSFQNEVDRPVEAKIYPNPCKQEIVNIELSAREISEIRIINIAGKEVLIKNYDLTENKKQVRLDDIPNGVYILKIKSTDNKTVVRKLMVTKE